ncbi:MAG: hypothetical protein ACXW15_06350 [Acidimicrobiia bacterium]
MKSPSELTVEGPKRGGDGVHRSGDPRGHGDFPDDATMERLEFIEDTGAFELQFQDFFTQAKS